MWKWDQGRMEYFQYDVLRTVARFVTEYDLKNSDPSFIRAQTEQPFLPTDYHPWRNHSRIFKLCLLVSEENGIAVPTDIARILARSGIVTCDEYLHFIVEATTDPSPALSDWNDHVPSEEEVRHPLCFALKYILAKVAGRNDYRTSITEIVGTYNESGFSGREEDTAFLGLRPRDFYPIQMGAPNGRQARESIKFISQISYLHYDGEHIIASLDQGDAHDIFQALTPISGPRAADRDVEIRRLASFFRDGSDHDFFEYKNTILSNVLESGFEEGGKVKKTHIVLERNTKLRDLFFSRTPTVICDACHIDTNQKYPWVDRVLDLHHVLPLSSGTRVDSRSGTMLEDLVPICPTCHRAVHRFYDGYLKDESKQDFLNETEARSVYGRAKEGITTGSCYAD